MIKMPTLGLIVPCYNEEEVLGNTVEKLISMLRSLTSRNIIDGESFVLFVDDGSKDKTWDIISKAVEDNKCVQGLKFSKNFGHQNAVLAGLLTIKDFADCGISIDADLQQDESCIEVFITEYEKGNDIVYGIRKDRATDGVIKKMTATFFYKIMHLLGLPILQNHADYRLTSRQVMQTLEGYQETNMFLRGIFPEMGFQSSIVYHDVRERDAGESKYTMKKMLSFAFNAITSFSIAPVRIITILGFIIFFLAVLFSLSLFIGYFIDPSSVVPGWASTILPIYFLGGVQLLSIGVVGEYVGRTYMETKKRPRYIIEKHIRGDDND